MTSLPVATFLAPPVILSGRGSVAEVGPRISTLVEVGGRAALRAEPIAILLAVDRVLVQTGRADPIVKALRRARMEPIVATEFGPELTAEQIDAVTSVARAANCAAVVGVGGGSVLDAAKMIAVLLTEDKSVRAHIGPLSTTTGRAPLALIPTTVGTGAEVTRISMVTIDGSKKIVAADVLIPDLAILDPSLVEDLPPQVVGSTGMDALAHAVESIMSLARTPHTQALAYGAIELVCEHLRPAYDGDAESRGQLLVAANLAGLALNAGVVLGHSLAYSAARLAPLAHGTSCALALPYAIAYNDGLSPDIAVRLSRALTRGRSDELRIAAAAVRQLAMQVEQPTTLTEAGIPTGGEEELARVCVEEYPRPTNPQPITFARVAALVETMRAGDLSAAFALARTETRVNA